MLKCNGYLVPPEDITSVGATEKGGYMRWRLFHVTTFRKLKQLLCFSSEGEMYIHVIILLGGH